MKQTVCNHSPYISLANFYSFIQLIYVAIWGVDHPWAYQFSVSPVLANNNNSINNVTLVEILRMFCEFNISYSAKYIGHASITPE